MKRMMGTLALVSAAAGAHAQSDSSVVIYGNVDAGIVKQSGASAGVARRDHNRLGFRGSEDLGNGLKAVFQLEVRFEPDTGTLEAGSRPLFQGQSRVGLAGKFGTFRLGRALTAAQESSSAFDPWNGLPTPAGFQTDLLIAAFNSDPLGAPGNSQNRMSNGVFYNSPVLSGLQLNVSYGTKETQPAGTPLVTPYSVSATYTAGAFQAMLASERNPVDSELVMLGASYYPTRDLKVMAMYAAQDRGVTVPLAPDISSWVVGANYSVGAGKVLVGYGQKSPDGAVKTREASLGYEYSLSKRSYLYADASRKRQAVANSPLTNRTVNYYSLGIHHKF